MYSLLLGGFLGNLKNGGKAIVENGVNLQIGWCHFSWERNSLDRFATVFCLLEKIRKTSLFFCRKTQNIYETKFSKSTILKKTDFFRFFCQNSVSRFSRFLKFSKSEKKGVQNCSHRGSRFFPFFQNRRF